MTPELKALERLSSLFKQRAEAHEAQSQTYQSLAKEHERHALIIAEARIAVDAEIAKLKESTK